MSSTFAKRWLADPAAWPIFGVIGGAVTLSFCCSMRYLTKSPDVHWNKTSRGTPVRENDDEGINFSSHRSVLAYLRPNACNEHPELKLMSRTLSRRNTKEDYDTTETRV